jgi:hypothetical protein
MELGQLTPISLVWIRAWGKCGFELELGPYLS